MKLSLSLPDEGEETGPGDALPIAIGIVIRNPVVIGSVDLFKVKLH